MALTKADVTDEFLREVEKEFFERYKLGESDVQLIFRICKKSVECKIILYDCLKTTITSAFKKEENLEKYKNVILTSAYAEYKNLKTQGLKDVANALSLDFMQKNVTLFQDVVNFGTVKYLPKTQALVLSYNDFTGILTTRSEVKNIIISTLSKKKGNPKHSLDKIDSEEVVSKIKKLMKSKLQTLELSCEKGDCGYSFINDHCKEIQDFLYGLDGRLFGDVCAKIRNRVYKMEYSNPNIVYIAGKNGFNIDFDVKKKKITYDKQTKELLDFLMNNKTQKCAEFVLEKFEKEKENKIYVKCTRLFLENRTKLYIKDGFYEEFYPIEKIPTTSVTKFKKQFSYQWNAIINSFKKESERIKKESMETTKPFVGNVLARGICEIVKANDKKITSANIVSKLRGTNSNHTSFLKKTPFCGKFNEVSSEEIEDLVYQLNHSDILYAYLRHGDYCNYYVYGTSNLLQPILEQKQESIKKILQSLKKEQPITDDDAYVVLLSYKEKDELTTEDYLYLLQLINCKGFICLYGDEFVSLFKNANTDIQKIIKMKKTIEDDKFKTKVYNRIQNAIKEEKRFKKSAISSQS